MSGVVHFKFKSAISYDSVHFDGAFVTVGEIKNLIADKRGLAREATAELILSDPRTNAEYRDDSQQLSRSTSVLVRRAPAARLRPLEGGAEQPLASAAPAPARRPAQPLVGFSPQNAASQQQPAPPQDGFGAELYAQQAEAASRISDDVDGLASRLAAEGATWQKELAGGRGRGRGRGRAGNQIPPPNYVCFRCNQTGHYINQCPTNGDPEFDQKRLRNPVGIPMSRLGVSSEGGLNLPGGQVGSLIPNEDVFQREMFGSAPAASAAPQQPTIAPPSSPLMLDSKPHVDEPTSSAMVVFSAPDAGPPALAGEDQLFQALAQPVVKPQPKPEAAPALPLPMPFLPGQAPFMPTFGPSIGQPLSKEEFERLRKDATRKKRRSASGGSSRSRSRSPARRSRRSRRSRSSSERSSRSPEASRRHRGRDAPRHRASSSRLGRRDVRESSPSAVAPSRVPRHEVFQRRWRPPPGVSDSPLRYGSRARAKQALSEEAAQAHSAGPELERAAPGIDRWEPGSDFESTKPAQRTSRRRVNGVDSSAPAGRAATPKPVRRLDDDPVADSAAGPAGPDRIPDRSVPVPRPVSLPAQPIALLDDMDAGMPFSSAAAAIQQPRVKDSDQSKKHKKDKHKKESKEKKHKKHKKDKRAKGDKDEDGDSEMEEAEEAGRSAAPSKQADAKQGKASPGTVRPNPRLFQVQAAAVSAARGAQKRARH